MAVKKKVKKVSKVVQKKETKSKVKVKPVKKVKQVHKVVQKVQHHEEHKPVHHKPKSTIFGLLGFISAILSAISFIFLFYQLIIKYILGI